MKFQILLINYIDVTLFWFVRFKWETDRKARGTTERRYKASTWRTGIFRAAKGDRGKKEEWDKSERR